MNQRMRFLLVLLALAGSGCRQQRWDTPTEAYTSWAGTLRRGEWKAAWAGLSSPSRKGLEDRVAALKGAAPSIGAGEPSTIAFAAGVKQRPLKDVTLVKQDGDVAVVRVTPVDGEPVEQRMVKEGDRWTVDLGPAVLLPSARDAADSGN